MRCCRLLLVSLLLAVGAAPAPAGIIFGKKGQKPDPAQRVPELLVLVKTDGDERKREAAAEELRQYDPKLFPEIVPVLIDVLLNDPKPAVRSEAAVSLGKLRPISQQAGWALEQAVAKDASMRVRLQARSALLHYHWDGYRGSKEPPVIQSKEPPLAPPPQGKTPGDPAGARLAPKPAQPAGSPAPVVNTGNVPRPLPSGPPLVPADAPRLQPLPVSPDSGPDLRPPQ